MCARVTRSGTVSDRKDTMTMKPFFSLSIWCAAALVATMGAYVGAVAVIGGGDAMTDYGAAAAATSAALMATVVVAATSWYKGSAFTGVASVVAVFAANVGLLSDFPVAVSTVFAAVTVVLAVPIASVAARADGFTTGWVSALTVPEAAVIACLMVTMPSSATIVVSALLGAAMILLAGFLGRERAMLPVRD